MKKLNYYWSNGNILSEFSINEEDKIVGLYKGYYDNGELEIEAMYDNSGERIGWHKFYHKDGSLDIRYSRFYQKKYGFRIKSLK